jgi:hypothetical protein
MRTCDRRPCPLSLFSGAFWLSILLALTLLMDPVLKLSAPPLAVEALPRGWQVHAVDAKAEAERLLRSNHRDYENIRGFPHNMTTSRSCPDTNARAVEHPARINISSPFL